MGTLQVQKMPHVAFHTLLQHLGLPANEAFLTHWHHFHLPFPGTTEYEEYTLVPNDIVCDAIMDDIEADVGSRPFYMIAQYLKVIPAGFLRISEGGEKHGVTVIPEDPNCKPLFFDESTVCNEVLETFQQKWEDAVDEDTMILLIPPSK